MEFDLQTQRRIQEWLSGDYDEEVKKEIRRLLTEDPEKLHEAFFQEITFGTGGMRGLMGVGTNRINIYTIRQVTQGVANHLNRSHSSPSVFIGYDVRDHSRKFAEETANVLIANNIRVFISKEFCPTPLVSFACRYFSCTAAVMITASHNPAEYNGYKVYGKDGGQILPADAEKILDEYRCVAGGGARSNTLLKEKIFWVGEELDSAYLQNLSKLQIDKTLSHFSLKIIYSNLHGTGIRLIPRALKSWGYNFVFLVEKQKNPDGSFPSVKIPNPEEEKAFELGIEELLKKKGDLLLVTDPDADRIGALVFHNQKPYRFSGNQMACLCLYHICRTWTEQGIFPKKGHFIKTIVTTELFRQIAESFGGTVIDVPTGFKYIGEKIAFLEKNLIPYVFGAEESCGYLFGSFVRDKDAISSSCLIAEIAALAKKEGITLVERLHQIYQRYGIYREQQNHLCFPDSANGKKQMQDLMDYLRTHLPKEVGEKKLILHQDSSDMLCFWLEDQTKIVIRPSGTESKLKIYTQTVFDKLSGNIQKDIDEADLKLAKTYDDFFSLLGYFTRI